MLTHWEHARDLAAINAGRAEGAPRVLSWATWRLAVGLILAALVVRIAYLIWFCPYQLLGDEAYYWEQARHFDLCYNEKGPVLGPPRGFTDYWRGHKHGCQQQESAS